MKKIIINGRFLTQKITGVQRYAREIIAELDKIIEKDEFEIAIPPETIDVPDYKNIKIVRLGRLNNRLWEHISFPWYVMKQGGTSLNLCNVAPLINPGIVCIHDVKIKATPQFFSKKFLLWYGLLFWNATHRAKKIITVSEFSKSEIIKYYNVEPERVCVIPNGWQHFERIAYDENTLGKYDLGQYDYYFAMSSLEPNKNFKWIAETAKKNPEEKFVIAGSINKKVFADGLGFECPQNMSLIGYVTDQEAKTLMRDSKAFLFPSIYEGFGIPPLEAMSAGAKRIIVSDIPVMHEVFGDSVEYIHKNGANIISDSKIRKKYCFSNFSWCESAKKLRALLVNSVIR